MPRFIKRQILTILILLCSGTLFAETDQATLRMANPFFVEVSPVPRYNHFSFGWQYRPDLAFGFSMFRPDLFEYSDLRFNGAVLMHEEFQYTQPDTYLFAHYNPFDSPLYLSAALGRTAGGQKSVSQLLQRDLYELRLADSQPSVSYTLTDEPANYIAMGIGYRWLFTQSLSLATEFRLRSSSSRKTAYVYQDFRSLLTGQSLPPEALYLMAKNQESAANRAGYSGDLFLTAGFRF